MALIILSTAGMIYGADKIPDQGVKLKPFPLAAYNSDLGLGLGLSLTLIGYDGKSSDYLYKIYTEFMYYTGGQIDPDIRFDIPNIWIGEQPFRITGIAEYKQARFQPYYGTGNNDLVNGYTYDMLTNDYQYTNRYNMVNPYIFFTITTPLVWGLQKGYDKEIGLALGAYLDNYSISNSYTNAPDGSSVYIPSKIYADNPFGVEGGTIFSLNLGINFDSRDYIPNPGKGTYNEVMAEISLHPVYSYQRLTLLHQAYFSLCKTEKRHLILAERVWIDNLFGQAPFFKQGKLGGFQYVDGFGGADSMRGLGAFRSIGKFKMFITTELRWRFVNFGPFLGDMWHLELTPFADIGNAWDSINEMSLGSITATLGTGLKVLWGEDFIIAFDYGFWKNPSYNNWETGLYIGFNHQF